MQTPPPVCQLSQGLVMLPPCTHTQNPPTTFEVASFVSHGVSSSAQSALLFCVSRLFLFPPFSVLAVVLSFKQTLFDLAGILLLSHVHCTLCQSPTFGIKWHRSGGCKNPLL